MLCSLCLFKLQIAMHVFVDSWFSYSPVERAHTEHYSGVICSVSLAYNEFVCRLNWPNAHSHSADLSLLISPKNAASPLVRVHHLCQQFFQLPLIEKHLIWVIDSSKLSLTLSKWVCRLTYFPINVNKSWKLTLRQKQKVCQVWPKVLKNVSRATQASCGHIEPNEVSKHCSRISTFQIQALERSELFVPFCPYIMGSVLRGHTDCSAPSGSCSTLPHWAWNNISCSLFGSLRLETGIELILGLITLLWFTVGVEKKKNAGDINVSHFCLQSGRLQSWTWVSLKASAHFKAGLLTVSSNSHNSWLFERR